MRLVCPDMPRTYWAFVACQTKTPTVVYNYVLMRRSSSWGNNIRIRLAGDSSTDTGRNGLARSCTKGPIQVETQKPPYGKNAVFTGILATTEAPA